MSNCVEVEYGADGYVHVTDSKSPTGGGLTFTPDEFRAFTESAKLGEFDIPA